jgi:hypothetical protein
MGLLTVMTRYYYTKDGTDVQGPILQADLQAMYSAGILGRDAQVCQEGSEEWQPLSDLFPISEKKISSHANIQTERGRPARSNGPRTIILAGIVLFVFSAAVVLFQKIQKNTPSVSQPTASASPGLHTEVAPNPTSAETEVMETQSPPPKPAQLSDATKKDIQDIFIAGDQLFDLAGDVIRCRKSVEMDDALLDIDLDTEEKLAQIGSSANKQETDAAFAKKDADKKLFDDALSKYSEVQVTAKTKIDFLNLPGSPSVTASLQQASDGWAEFRSTAAAEPGEKVKTSDRLEQLKESAAALFDKAKTIVKEQLQSAQ